MKTRLLYLFACLVLLGCETNESEENKPEEPAELYCYPEEIVQQTNPASGNPWELTQRFGYNELGDLTSIKSFVNGTLLYEDTFEYNSKGQVSNETWYFYGEKDRYIEHEYDAQGKLLSDTHYNFDNQQQKGAVASKVDYVYTSPTQLQSLLAYTAIDGTLQLEYKNIYTYTNGLMTKIESYNSDNQLTKETVLTYDDKKNYMRGLPNFRAQLISEGFPHQHNVMTKTVKDAAGNVITAESYTRGAEYNGSDYLVLQFTSYGDGRVQERNYTYDCPQE